MTASGGYAMVETPVDPGDRVVELAPEQAGLALVFRDEGYVVGFEAFERADLPSGSVRLDALVTPAVRVAATSSRLRDAARAEGGDVPSLTVAVCTKDRPDWLARLLGSLLPLREGRAFEILVVDNAPSDERTRKVCGRHAKVTYLREPVAGLDFARNTALANARGEVIAFLDDDVVVDPLWLEGLSSAWRDNPDAGAVTGLVMPLRLDTEAQVLFERRGGFRRGFHPLRYGASAPYDRFHPFGAGKFGAGANMSLRTELFRKLGGFDEALDTGRPLPGGGDLDAFLRVLRSGATLAYEPRMAVFHDHREAMSVLARQYYTWGLGFAAFASKSKAVDPSARPAINGVLRWWFADQLRRLGLSLLGRGDTPPGMVLGEVRGGIVGLCGEYGRSRRRSATLKAAQREVAPS